MTKSALFLVQSPLHVHNAHEAIIQFGISRCTFLVVTSTGNEKWAKMMMVALPASVDCLFAMRNVHDIEGTTQSYAQHIPWLKSQAFDLVFFSDSRLYIFADIVNALQHPNTYLMDDGFGIIQTVHTIVNTGKYFDFAESTIPERRKLMEQVKIKYDIWQLPQIKYDLFTAFDYQSSEMFKVIGNPMSRITFAHQQVNQHQVLILGQPFVKSGYMTSECYISTLLQMQQRYIDKQMLYLPHPREKEQDLHEICEQTALKMISTDLSAEEYLMQLPIAPAKVSGFYSAALWYIAKFQAGIQVDAHRLSHDVYEFPPERLMQGSSYLKILDVVDIAYDYFQFRIKVFNTPISRGHL